MTFWRLLIPTNRSERSSNCVQNVCAEADLMISGLAPDAKTVFLVRLETLGSIGTSRVWIRARKNCAAYAAGHQLSCLSR